MKYSQTNFRQKDKSEIKSQTRQFSEKKFRDLDLDVATRGVLRTHIYTHEKVLLFELEFFQELSLD